MLDADNVDNLALRQLSPNSGHLRRLLTSTTQADEPKCECILLLPYTRIGQSNTNNHVVLNCSEELNNAILGCHAIIRSVVTDKLHGNISNYELVAQPNACVYINCCQIETLKPQKLYPGDCILFGDKATNFDGFMFRFEPAEEKLNYPVMRQNLQPEFTSPPHNLILYSNSLNYRVGDLSHATIENEANLAHDAPLKQPFSTQKPLVSELIYDLINNCQSTTTTYSASMPLNFSSKENVISYVRPSTSIKASAVQHSFADLNNGNMLQLCPTLPETRLIEKETKTHLLNDKFDVDIYEVVKRIASRIANKQDNLNDDLDSTTNNGDEKSVVEDTNLQLPMIASAANLNVYQCSTSLTPSSSASPPCSIDFRHTPSSSSSVFNNSDTSGYSTNDNSGNCTINNNNLTPSPVCVDDDEEERKSLKDEKVEETEDVKIEEDELTKPLSKSASATSLQLLAALASNDYNDENNSKPLEIFIPLASCSDGDEGLSPAQTLKSEKLVSPTPSSTHRGPKPRSSRQSTHENDEAHTHTTKQLKMQAGIESCRKRMFKYIANNMYTTQIVKHYQPIIPSPLIKPESTQDVEMEVPKIAADQQINVEPPVPLNLYPDGEEFVTKEVKTRRNSKKQTVHVDTITDAEQHLFATLLLHLRPPSGPSTLDSSTSSSNTVSESTNSNDVEVKQESPVNEPNTKCEEMEVDKEERKKVVVRPSKEERQVFLQAEQMLPRIPNVGRHTVAKYRLLYRSELDRTNAETVATQRYRLIERCREDRLKCEEKMKQVQQRKQQIAERRKSNAKRSNADQLPSPTGRNTLGSPVARLPIVKKSSTSKQSGTLTLKRQSNDYCTPLSIHQLAKDPNFDGFLADEPKSKDPFRFDEEEDPFSGKKTTSPLNRPFFVTENTRSAAISANQAIHTTQQKRSRKRRQSGDPNVLDKNVAKPTPKGKRGRQPGQKVGKQGKRRKIEKEEPCAFDNCSPQHIQIVSASSAIEWVACDICLQWFHCICALGLNRPVGESERFQCCSCQQSN